MKSMKLLAAIAAVSFASAAQAVEIKFEFSGIVGVTTSGFDNWAGQRATGTFLIETDNFSILPSPPPQVTWTDVLPFNARPAPIGASLSMGSETISLNSAVETYGGIHFVGGCDSNCYPGWRENWGISGNTQSFPLGGQPSPDGYRVTSLIFGSLGPVETDFIPASGLTPLDILTLPLGQLSASYNVIDFACVDGQCAQSGYETVQWQIDSVTRTLVPPAAVPEPATLVLFGTALLGMGALRARRRAVRA